jgi:tetraacyldisaccharide 4'-kinase
MYVSTTTLAGRDAAEQRTEGLARGVFFAPLDYRFIVRRVLRRIRPAVVVVLETEIWPNLYRESKRAGAGLLIVNGRISDRTLPRYRAWKRVFQHVLRWPDGILAQSEEDRRRFVLAGAPKERVRVAGNLKYDFTQPSGIASELVAFLDRVRPGSVWIAASTAAPVEPGDPDEDDVVIEAFQRLAQRQPGLLLILAPRRPERFSVVTEKLRKAGVAFVRRSEYSEGLTLPGVLLLDSIGELAGLFSRATVVFMGGTLARRGGHNILEPAFFGKPVIVGPHMENFAEIAQEFSAAGALVKIEGPEALYSALESVLEGGNEVGARARELAISKRGTADRVAHEILATAANAVVDPRRTLAARLTLGPLAYAWGAGHRIHIAAAKARALNTRVVSIGSLAMGGAGKSPMVAHLADRAAAAGRSPAILTRGYRRKSTGEVIVKRGGTAGVELTGDEAQMFVRQGSAHVGISADRYQTGLRMEQELKPDLFLLDDGFQHLRLRRDEDIVLIDALDPLGGRVFPLGRLREPLTGLARATAIVITRADHDVSGIEKLIRRYNSSAPIFRSRVVAREWVDIASGGVCEPRFKKVAAFCGLASPGTFWNTLEDLGLEVVGRKTFADHHRYAPADLRGMGAADAVVTTEKDAMNLFPGAAEAVAPLRMYYLKIGIEIEDEERLLQRIL